MSKKKKKETRSKSKTKKTKDQAGRLYSNINLLLEAQAGRGITFKQIVKKLNLKKKEDVKKAGFYLDELVEYGKIKQLENGSYIGEGGDNEFTGIVDHVNSRFAYVKIGEDRKDIYVKTQDLRSAIDGDTVRVATF